MADIFDQLMEDGDIFDQMSKGTSGMVPSHTVGTNPNKVRQPVTAGRVAKGLVSNAENWVKGAYNLVTHPWDTAVNVGQTGLGALQAMSKDAYREYLGDPVQQMMLPSHTPYQSPLEQKGRAAMAGVERFARNVKDDPLGYAADNPLDAITMLSGGLGGLGKVAGVLDFPRAAEALGTAASWTNPITGTAKTAEALYPRALTPSGLIESSLKLPLSKRWTKAMLAEDGSSIVTDRKRAIAAVREHGFRPDETGIVEATRYVQNQGSLVDDKLAAAAQAGKQVSVEDAVTKGMEQAYKDAATSGNPIKAREALDAWKEEYLSENSGKTGVDIGNELKRGLWRDSRWAEASPSANPVDRVVGKAKKGVGHQLKEQIEAEVPEVKSLNADEGAAITALEALTRAVPRIQNHDIMPITSKILWGSNPGASILNAVAGHPQIKMAAARAMDAPGKALNKFKEFMTPESGFISDFLDDGAPPKPFSLSDL